MKYLKFLVLILAQSVLCVGPEKVTRIFLTNETKLELSGVPRFILDVDEEVVNDSGDADQGVVRIGSGVRSELDRIPRTFGLLWTWEFPLPRLGVTLFVMGVNGALSEVRYHVRSLDGARLGVWGKAREKQGWSFGSYTITYQAIKNQAGYFDIEFSVQDVQKVD